MTETTQQTRNFDEQVEQVKDRIERRIQTEFGITARHAGIEEVYKATALCVRDDVACIWAQAREKSQDSGEKCLAYLSAEFLVGRALANNLVNLDAYAVYERALEELGFDLGKVEEQESDASLGNGGLGRLAACFLDSLATLGLPAVGYGLLYENGFFKQVIEDGRQVELADPWLDSGGVWLAERPDRVYEVRFGGNVEEKWTCDGHLDVVYHGSRSVYARAFDMPILGYGDNSRPSTLRLWKAVSPHQVDFGRFQNADYTGAVAEIERDEAITKFLYPDDSHHVGKELRLRQFYFMVSATMQSIVESHKSRFGDLSALPDKLVVQINDTHPALAIPELVRILIDEEDFTWEEAMDVVEGVFNYTNHTVMPEALEKWPADMLMRVAPRVYKVIETIDAKFRDRLWRMYPGDVGKLERMAIIRHGEVRMANLCVLVSAHVNGVSQLHGELLRTDLFRDFNAAFPDKFCGITNGITQRRWLKVANPGLSQLIDETIGEGFMTDWRKSEELAAYAQDDGFRTAYQQVKEGNKVRFAEWMMQTHGMEVEPNSIFDVQAKRLHEYKRQLLKAIHIISLCDEIAAGRVTSEDLPAMTFVFAAKAAPGYWRAKEVIRLLNALSSRIARDEVVRKLVSVVFLPGYDVTSAQYLMPASDISEQLSLAGTEASGTGNMKFMMNGALTLGTMDGANIEIAEQVGDGNIFIFGADVAEVEQVRKQGYNAQRAVESNPKLARAVGHLVDGSLASPDGARFENLYHALLSEGDHYLVCHDFASYDEAFWQAVSKYKTPDQWYASAVVNTAKAGYFSSDRTIKEYCRKIWGIDTNI